MASLHSHTLCSRETLAFLNKLSRNSLPVRWLLDHGKARYQQVHGSELDLHRAWWTPPIAPRDAWQLEAQQIARRFGLEPLVSLTDHDSVEAPVSLRILEQCRNLPISVEWTVPFGPTFFHLGVHNLPPESARSWMAAMAQYTASRKTLELRNLLADLHALPAVLIVFNHPCWDESGIGAFHHAHWASHFASEYGASLDAFELNGLRPWPENRLALRMAQEFSKPVISGGDRHALEPNTVLDLTHAQSFSEYVEQVRQGYTDVLITGQYREPFSLRILQNLEDVMNDQPQHGRGWYHWSDRVFFRTGDEVVRPLSALFPNKMPAPIQWFTSGLQLVRQLSVRRTVRSAFFRTEELAL